MLIGEVVLWIAAVLTLVTGYDYLPHGLTHMTARTDRPGQRPACQAARAARVGRCHA